MICDAHEGVTVDLMEVSAVIVVDAALISGIICTRNDCAFSVGN